MRFAPMSIDLRYSRLVMAGNTIRQKPEHTYTISLHCWQPIDTINSPGVHSNRIPKDFIVDMTSITHLYLLDT